MRSHQEGHEGLLLSNCQQFDNLYGNSGDRDVKKCNQGKQHPTDICEEEIKIATGWEGHTSAASPRAMVMNKMGLQRVRKQSSAFFHN